MAPSIPLSHVHADTYKHAHMHMHTHTHTLSLTHSLTHTHTHTHTHTAHSSQLTAHSQTKGDLYNLEDSSPTLLLFYSATKTNAPCTKKGAHVHCTCDHNVISLLIAKPPRTTRHISTSTHI